MHTFCRIIMVFCDTSRDPLILRQFHPPPEPRVGFGGERLKGVFKNVHNTKRVNKVQARKRWTAWLHVSHLMLHFFKKANLYFLLLRMVGRVLPTIRGRLDLPATSKLNPLLEDRTLRCVVEVNIELLGLCLILNMLPRQPAFGGIGMTTSNTFNDPCWPLFIYKLYQVQLV